MSRCVWALGDPCRSCAQVFVLDTALDLPEQSDVFELHTKQIEDKTFRPARHRTRFLHLLVASTSSSQLMEPKADASDVLEVSVDDCSVPDEIGELCCT
jgi:hypothetical protein